MTARQITGPVRQPLNVSVKGPDGCLGSERIELVFDPASPYEVQLIVEADGDNVWLFGRDLLADGVDAPAGLGEVHVYPGDATVRLELTNAESQETATLYIPAGVVQRFVAACERRVKPGAESMDVDAWLDERCAFDGCGRAVSQHDDVLLGHDWRASS